jgi:hypothetical protein
LKEAVGQVWRCAGICGLDLIRAPDFSETPSRRARTFGGTADLRFRAISRTTSFPSCATTLNGVVMSKNWMMLTGLLFLGSVGTLQAHPLDFPDLVYIDGLPCNRACQSYMAWSRQKKSSVAEQPAPEQPAPEQSAPEKPARRSSYSAVHPATTKHRETSKPAAHARVAKQAVPMAPAKIAEPQPAGDAAAASEAAPANVAASSPSGGEAAISDARTVPEQAAPAPAEPQPAGNATVASEAARANVAASSPSGGEAAISDARTVQEQVAAATALAEQASAASAAPVPQQEANNAETSGRTEVAQSSDTEQTASAPTSNTDNLVAVLMARPEIKSVSDLAGKDVAIEDRQSASSASIRTAIAAAGAVEVKLNGGNTKTIDRLIAGEVPAAILTLASPEAAEWFPDIAGYRIFRIPLSPRSVKARL